MRRLILFSIFFCISTVLSAQQLDMDIEGTVELREMDNDARAYKRIDRNDNVCALLKVTLTNPLPQNTRLVLEAGGFPVIHSELKDNGEYWFYVPYQVKNLYFSCQGYKAMDAVPAELKQGKVYRITIRNDVRFDTVTTVIVSSNYLKMNIFPEDAEVAIGKTLSYELPKEYLIDGKFSRLLDYGEYYVKITHPLYAEKTMTVTVSDSNAPVAVKLEPAYGYLSINTNPPGALVLINGERANGTTPLKIPEKIRTGIVSVTVQKRDWHPATVSVNVPSDGSVKTVDINLSANFGTVVCTCPDSEAELYVNGEYKGKGSWTGNVSSGITHKLESRKAGHRSQSVGFSVNDGQTLKKEVDAPIPLCGTLEVKQTVPEYCMVRIDSGSETEAPFIRNELLVGSHTLHITKDGYIPQTRTIEIAHNQKLTLSDVRLEKGRRKVSVKLSTGANAKIYGDNHEFLSNSSAWSGSMDEGWHDFYSSREGHNDGHIRAEVVYGKENDIRIPAPVVKTGTAKITATKNASVTLNGNGYTGELYTTPLTKQLPVGTYSLTASKKGYYNNDRTFSIQEGRTTDVFVNLKKRHWISEHQSFASHFGEITYGYGFPLGGLPGVDASLFAPPASENPDMEGDVEVDYSSYADKFDKAVRRSPHWYGLNYDFIQSHIGLHSSFAFTANGDVALAIGPNLRCTSFPRNDLDFQIYAGLGFRYDPYSPVQDPLFKSNHWKWMVDAGVRFNIDDWNDCCEFSFASLTLGAKFSSDKIIPTAGISLFPGIGAATGWYSERESFSRYFLEMTYGYGIPYKKAEYFDPSYRHWIGLNFDYIGKHLGLHSSLALSTNLGVSMAIGPTFRFTDDTSALDFQFYAGIGAKYEDNYFFTPDPLFKSMKWRWMVDTGFRFNIDAWNDYSSFSFASLTLGAKFSSDQAIPTVGLALFPGLLAQFDRYTDSHHYFGMSTAYDTSEDEWMAGAYYSWSPTSLGLYGSFLVGFDGGYSIAAGPMFSCLPDISDDFDLFLYGGMGVQNSEFMGDFGIRIDFANLDFATGLFDIGIGCQVYQGNFVPTFTLSWVHSLSWGWLIPLLGGLDVNIFD